ncbi:DUF4336 domain-containing protein [Myxococcaceae bacterium GXIMD 01537]
MLREVARDVWTREVRHSVGGLTLGGRCTLVRLPDGGLWVHSPVRLEEGLREAVTALGPVRFLVAPSLMHHLFIPAWAAAFPEARVLAPAGLRRKRPELRIDAELGGAPEPAWGAALDVVPLGGMPRLDEFAFLHRPSRTLLLTDLAFNIHQSPSWLTRAYLRLCGAYGRLAPTWVLKACVKDRAALRASLERVLAWDFERVSVCHGEVLERDGREALRRAFEWL